MAESVPPKFYAEFAEFPELVELRPIGIVRSPHKERHGTPRQAVLPADPTHRSDERTELRLFGGGKLGEHAVEDLEGFEFIWVISWLHLNHGWNNKVHVPGDEKKSRGLLSTRAPHRPNPIGLSAVRLSEVRGMSLFCERTDLLDGTPILDIKPYVPYADAFPSASAGWLDTRPTPRG